MNPIETLEPGVVVRIVVDEGIGKEGIPHSRMPSTFFSLPGSRVSRFAIIGYLVTPEFDAQCIASRRNLLLSLGLIGEANNLKAPITVSEIRSWDGQVFSIQEVVGWSKRSVDAP